jgi:predicted metal-binding protein
MNYRIELLKSFNKNTFESLGSIFVCRVCEKKVDIKKYQEESRDKYTINELKYRNKKNGIQNSPEELLKIQLLNIKLKRELNGRNKK